MGRNLAEEIGYLLQSLEILADEGNETAQWFLDGYQRRYSGSVGS